MDLKVRSGNQEFDGTGTKQAFHQLMDQTNRPVEGAAVPAWQERRITVHRGRLPGERSDGDFSKEAGSAHVDGKAVRTHDVGICLFSPELLHGLYVVESQRMSSALAKADETVDDGLIIKSASTFIKIVKGYRQGNLGLKAASASCA